MGNEQLISIFLTDGTTISYRKPYNYFEKANITKSIEKAEDGDLVTFKSHLETEVLIPKKNILYVKFKLVDPDDEDKEVFL